MNILMHVIIVMIAGGTYGGIIQPSEFMEWLPLIIVYVAGRINGYCSGKEIWEDL